MGNVDGPKARNFLANKYMKQLERLGYVEFRDKTIRSKNGPLYRLIFASNHERGGEFWDKVTRKNAEGQRDLPFS